MAAVDSAMKSVSSILKGAVELGLSLAVVALVVDILFPGTTGIVGNVSALVTSFTGNGLVGLISLLFFLSIYKD